MKTVRNRETPFGVRHFFAEAGWRKLIWLMIPATMTLLLNSGIWALFYFNGWVSGEESGGMETTQALMLALTAIVFSMVVYFSSSRSERLFFGAFLLLSISFLFRELDVEDYNLPALLIWFGSGAGRNACLGGLWAATAVALLFHRNRVLVIARQWLVSPGGLLTLMAGVTLVSSVPFEKEWFEMAPATSLFWEEIQEMNGYLLLLLAACASLRKVRATCD